MENKSKKEGFSSSLGVFFATLSGAIGLGNIWKFPSYTGTYGGAAFILIYFGFVLLLGIPLMLSEFYIGRGTKRNPFGSIGAIKEEKYTKFKSNFFNKIRKSGFFKVIGWLGVTTAAFIMFYYSAVAGWVYGYLFKAIMGEFQPLKDLSGEEALKFTSDKFLDTISGGYMPIFWQLIVLIVVSAVLVTGVKKGIEKATKILMPLFLLLILLCDIRALSLSKAGEGLNFLFNPDFSKINSVAILTALGLAFFKLALSMGILIVYSNYFKKDTDLVGNSVKVALADTAISLMAGIAIFPVVFEFGMSPDAGASLLFKSIPLAFAKLPFGSVLLAVFLLLTAIAATTAMISLVEVPVSMFMEEFNMSRKKSVVISSLIIFIVGALTVHPKSIFGEVMIGKRNLFDFFGFMTDNIMMPIAALLTAIFIGYFISKESFKEELINYGQLNKNAKYIPYIRMCLRYIVPIFIILIFLNSMGVFK